MEVWFPPSPGVEVPVAELGDLILRSDFAIVRELQVEELPQPASPGMLNVSATWAQEGGGRVGLCVPVVGRDETGEILWGCCLAGASADDADRSLLESLLVPPAVLGRTRSVWLRLDGGTIS